MVHTFLEVFLQLREPVILGSLYDRPGGVQIVEHNADGPVGTGTNTESTKQSTRFMCLCGSPKDVSKVLVATFLLLLLLVVVVISILLGRGNSSFLRLT